MGDIADLEKHLAVKRRKYRLREIFHPDFLENGVLYNKVYNGRSMAVPWPICITYRIFCSVRIRVEPGHIIFPF